jgi:hypothetical protein
MDAQEDPEDRIRELERPLADTARGSELGAPPQPPGGYPYSPGPGGAPPPPPSPWTYGGGAFSGPPPKPPSGNRTWWILGTLIVVGMIALAGGIAAFAAHRLSGVKSIITSPPTISETFGPAPSTPGSTAPRTTRSKTPKPSTPTSASPTPPPGGNVSVSGVNENRTIACNDNVVSVSGVSNTVVITGHCTSLTVSGVQNSITVDSVDTIDASGFNNKVTYHSGAPKITNPGGSNQVQQG